MLRNLARLLLVLVAHLAVATCAQTPVAAGALRGTVTDPSGAVVPGARITLSDGSRTETTASRADGQYVFRVPPGSYTLSVAASGFAPLTISDILLTQGKAKELNLPLAMAVAHQAITVNAEVMSVGINPEQNSGALVFKGEGLNALSDDPNQLESELEQLAGTAAGPNGGEIYVDGFAGGRLPPKSSILEIRINQNPFSSAYDRIGYGRIEIVTKPGTEKLHGTLAAYGNDSAVNSSNPLVPNQPGYSMYSYSGDVEGPLGKHASFLLNAYRLSRQNQNMVDAVNPQNTAAKFTEAVPNPTSIFVLSPRTDVQFGRHTLSLRDYLYKSSATGSGVGGLYLATQGLDSEYEENTFQFSDTDLVGPRLVNELHFEWMRERATQTAASTAPEIVVSGAFVGGGNLAGSVQDHQNVFEIRDLATATAGNHTFRFGFRLRAWLDANLSTAGSNGVFTYSSLAAYQAAKPSQMSYSVIDNPLVRVSLADGALFFQDDWRVKANLMLGIGARYEAQNWMHDRSDWAPRLALAWSPGRASSGASKTVIRAGYGWFYERFTVPVGLGTYGDAPYAVQVEHDNRIHQQTYVNNNPSSPSSAVPSFHSVDPGLRSAVDMQTGVGVDRQFTNTFTANLTYLFTQGVHQYLSNNITAPAFNPASYTVASTAPAAYNYQFQSGGFFRQQQVIATVNAQSRALVLNGSYTFNMAHSDTQGVTSFVSVADNPGLDYGRASFAVRHHATILESYTAPFGFVVASLFTVQSGAPFNITIGNDLTGNNQFNARPAYGVCGTADVIATRYGCLDTNPAGKTERMVPFGAGIGPANFLLDLRLSKTFGIGPRIKSETGGTTLDGDSSIDGRGLSGNTSSIRLNASAPHRGSLTFALGASNVLNKVNWGTPDGVLLSPIFNQSQSLAAGPFANPTPGNRAFIFQSNFSF